MRLIVRLFSYTRPYACKRNWLLRGVILRSIQLPALTWLVAAVINGPIAGGDGRGIAIGALAFLVARHLARKSSCTSASGWRWNWAKPVVLDLRNEIFAHLQSLPMSFFNRTKLGPDHQPHDFRRRRRADGHARSAVRQPRAARADGGRRGVHAVVRREAVSDGARLVPVLWLINHYFRRKMSTALRQVRESFSRVTATLAESVNGIRVTQGFVRQDVNARMFGELVADHAQYNATCEPHARLLLAAVGFEQPVLRRRAVAGRRLSSAAPGRQLTSAIWSAFCSWRPCSSRRSRKLGNQYNQALTAMAGAERVFQAARHAGRMGRAADTAAALATMRGRVEFRDLSFGYDPERPVLHDINFMAEPGQTIALVGHTGSGKTSIINLIAKFYLPTRGELLIDGLRDPPDHRRVVAPADRHRAAEQFSVQRHRAGKHPRRPARGDRCGSHRRRRAASIAST